MPRYTRCPFYIDENKLTISCEDVCRSYDSLDKKWAWMDMYCDSWDWMKCPYAADRAEAYRRFEEGDDMALEKQEVEATKKEVESLIRKLGRANKRIERQQKKIDEQRMVAQSFQRKNEELYKKWRMAENTLTVYEKNIADQIQQLVDAYETRLAYMIDKYGPLSDKDVDEWREGKAFALTYAPPGEWVVRFEDDEKKDED